MQQKKGKVHGIGSSLLITLPREFVKENKIKKGDEVGILADHWLQVVPFRRVDEEVVKDTSIKAAIDSQNDAFIVAATKLSQQIRKKYPDYDWKELDYEVTDNMVVLKWMKLERKK